VFEQKFPSASCLAEGGPRGLHALTSQSGDLCRDVRESILQIRVLSLKVRERAHQPVDSRLTRSLLLLRDGGDVERGRSGERSVGRGERLERGVLFSELSKSRLQTVERRGREVNTLTKGRSGRTGEKSLLRDVLPSHLGLDDLGSVLDVSGAIGVLDSAEGLVEVEFATEGRTSAASKTVRREPEVKETESSRRALTNDDEDSIVVRRRTRRERREEAKLTTQAIISVWAFPPRLSCSSRVSSAREGVAEGQRISARVSRFKRRGKHDALESR
jgi:hypothetical protein